MFETILYIYIGMGLMFACLLFLMNAESKGVVWDVLWIVLIAALWPIFLFALIRSNA